MQDLEPSLRTEIDSAFRSAKQRLRDGDVAAAVKSGEEAWARLPEPRFGWDVSQSYVHALALMYRDARRFADGVALMNALFASGTVLDYEDRPRFVLGTIYYEMGDMENARRWLNEANKISKGRCFRDEPEKYREAITK